MPYKIKETKNKQFSVVNKDTGKVMSKGTTESKAKSQIKAIYANMKPEHRLRHRIGLMDGIIIRDPTHRNVIRLVKHLLKKEEIHGNGFWDSVWDGMKWAGNKFVDTLALPSQILNQIPFAKEAAEAFAPELAPVFEFVPGIAKYIYGTNTNQALTDLLGDFSKDKDYKTTAQKEAEAKAKIPSTPIPTTTPIPLAPTAPINPVDAKKYTENLDNIVAHIQQQYDASPSYVSPVKRDEEGNVIGLDFPLRFPMVYNYDENSKPMYLQDFLVNNGTAGKNFAQEEFGSTVLNQSPYAFLDFPINGGNIRKINYSKLGYSKY
jgi:hypothetical protein